MTDPFLAAIDALRASIQRDTELLRLLEQRAGVETHPPVPALPVAREAKPPASEPRRAALLKPAGDSKPGRTEKIDPAKLGELHKRGLTDSEIARELGRSQPGVSAALRCLNLPPNKPAAKAASEPVGSAHVVAAFLRERGVELTGPDDGRWKVNGRDSVDRDGLLKLANTKRAAIGKAPFAWAAL